MERIVHSLFSWCRIVDIIVLEQAIEHPRDRQHRSQLTERLYRYAWTPNHGRLGA